MLEYDNKMFTCFLDLGMEILKGKWKTIILYHLDDEPVRFLELQKRIGGISQKVLNNQLKSLEKEGIISRKIYPEIPPKVEYYLTEKGLKLIPALKMLADWTIEHFADQVIDHYKDGVNEKFKK